MYTKRKTTGFIHSTHLHFWGASVFPVVLICCVEQAYNVVLEMCSCMVEECFIKIVMSEVLLSKCIICLSIDELPKFKKDWLRKQINCDGNSYKFSLSSGPICYLNWLKVQQKLLISVQAELLVFIFLVIVLTSQTTVTEVQWLQNPKDNFPSD